MWKYAINKKKFTIEHVQVKFNDNDSDEELPLVCLICRQEFKNPVVTHCELQKVT